MQYPGRVIKSGEQDSAIVRAIGDALATFGYSPPSTGQYDGNFAAVVKLFQSHHADASGRPLKIDGQVGPLTWGALFSAAPAPPPAASLGTAALSVAVSELGVTEDPPGSNSGPRVNEYLASVHCPPGSYWCMAFVNWCFVEAARQMRTANPWPDDASCVSVWETINRRASSHIVTRQAAIADPGRVIPGMVFIHDYGGGHGHTGFVEINNGGALETIEGNADPMGGSNGLEVLRVNRRSIMDGNLKGFIQF